MESPTYFYLEDLTQPCPKQARVFTCMPYMSFENTVGKGEIAPFLTVFSALSKNFPPFSHNEKSLSANTFSVEESIFFRLGKGLEAIPEKQKDENLYMVILRRLAH